MKKFDYQVPISLITIFHPERFWNMTTSDLEKLPALKKDRKDQELKKKNIAKEKKLELNTERIHDRNIGNFGNPNYKFRRNWIYGKDLVGLLSDYSFRLIDTMETGSQTRWRVEIRPNWGKEPNKLPEELFNRMVDAFSELKISIRQIYINPFTFDFKETTKGPFYESGYTANLLLGPCDRDKAECIREARIRFRKHDTSLSIHEHRPFYRDSLLNDEIEIIGECMMWWIDF